MSGFGNPILGGQSKLIRPAIQSPNYVPNISGWTINKDGSAEFNNVQIRGGLVITSVTTGILVYVGPPALGNLLFSLTANNGVDAYGNVYQFGLTSYSVTPFNLRTNADATVSSTQINADGINGLNIDAGNAITLRSGRDSVAGPVSRWNSNGIAISLGTSPVGKYYYEEVTTAAQVIPSAIAVAQLTNLVSVVNNSDYGSAFALVTGVWTCPVTGIYTHSMSLAFNAWVGGSRVLATMARAGVAFAREDKNTNLNGPVCLSMRKYFTIGDTVTYNAGQVTGGNQTLAGGTEGCAITVQREL